MTMKPQSLTDRLSTAEHNLTTTAAELKSIREELTVNPTNICPPEVDLDKVHTWEDVARSYNEHPTQSLPYPEPKDADQENTNAFHQVKRIIKLFNNDPSFPDFNNSKQDKLAAAFDMRTSPGFGFSGSRCGARLS